MSGVNVWSTKSLQLLDALYATPQKVTSMVRQGISSVSCGARYVCSLLVRPIRSVYSTKVLNYILTLRNEKLFHVLWFHNRDDTNFSFSLLSTHKLCIRNSRCHLSAFRYDSSSLRLHEYLLERSKEIFNIVLPC